MYESHQHFRAWSFGGFSKHTHVSLEQKCSMLKLVKLPKLFDIIKSLCNCEFLGRLIYIERHVNSPPYVLLKVKVF